MKPTWRYEESDLILVHDFPDELLSCLSDAFFATIPRLPTVLDMRNVTFLGCADFGVLIVFSQKYEVPIKKNRRPLAIIASDDVRQMLSSTGTLDVTLADNFESAKTAVRAWCEY
jgi:hypothetical protein